MSLLRYQGWFPLVFSIALVGSTTSAIPAFAGGLHDHFARKYDVVQGYIIQGSSAGVAGSTVASIPAQQFQVAVPVQQTQAPAREQSAVAASAQNAAMTPASPQTPAPSAPAQAQAQTPVPALFQAEHSDCSDDPDGVRARPDSPIHADARRTSDADRSGCDRCSTGPDRPHGRGTGGCAVRRHAARRRAGGHVRPADPGRGTESGRGDSCPVALAAPLPSLRVVMRARAAVRPIPSLMTDSCRRLPHRARPCSPGRGNNLTKLLRRSECRRGFSHLTENALSRRRFSASRCATPCQPQSPARGEMSIRSCHSPHPAATTARRELCRRERT